MRNVRRKKGRLRARKKGLKERQKKDQKKMLKKEVNIRNESRKSRGLEKRNGIWKGKDLKER